jgi:hypothetical protein
LRCTSEISRLHGDEVNVSKPDLFTDISALSGHSAILHGQSTECDRISLLQGFRLDTVIEDVPRPNELALAKL